MQIIPILITMAVISIVQAALVTRIPKPKLNPLFSQKLELPQIPKHKSPEERRKFSLFPKSYMKYVISPEPIFKIATHKPIAHGTKKPLMKKLKHLDQSSNAMENEAILLTVFSEAKIENNLAVTPKVDVAVGNEEDISIGDVEENSEESKENKNDNNEEEDGLQNDSKEIKTSDINDKESHNEVEVNQDSKNMKSDASQNSEDNQSLDWTEFILVDPAHTITEIVKLRSEESEDYITTEFYEEPDIRRKKRGSNVIEEENITSTVSGYKYTWKDTRLNNDVSFKNINS